MNARWVASATRGRGLSGGLVGTRPAEEIAASSSLREGLELLGKTKLGRSVTPELTLEQAEREVGSATLWQLRVLAGWGPALGLAGLRVVAGRYEIENIVELSMKLNGDPGATTQPYQLGTLQTAWNRARQAHGMTELRRVLGSSSWGDPSADEPIAIRLAMELAWARRLASVSSDAADLAAAYEAIITARLTAEHAIASLGSRPSRDVEHFFGLGLGPASSLKDVAKTLKRRSSFVLEGLDDASELWIAENRWWGRLEERALELSRSTPPSASCALGTGLLLIADARRIRASLELASRGGSRLVEVTGVVA